MGMGPGYGLPAGKMPSYEDLREFTGAAFLDLDASPTKAWLTLNRERHQQAFDFAVGRRPLEELYDVRKDPT